MNLAHRFRGILLFKIAHKPFKVHQVYLCSRRFAIMRELRVGVVVTKTSVG